MEGLVMRISPTFFSAIFLGLMAGFGSARAEVTPPVTVGYVDVERYMGLWYEIASIPQPFSQGCVATTAEYGLRDDGRIDVTNRCLIGSFTGREITAEGIARSVSKGNDKLKVTFQEPFEGDYWIVDLAADYSYAVVSVPDRSALWILNREPVMDDSLYQSILGQLAARGFDLSLLNKTPQP